MAWRDDKARATLIREAAGSVQPGKTPRTFAELLFGHTNLEDLASCDVPSLVFLAEQAWEHVQQRTKGSADIRVINPIMPDGREPTGHMVGNKLRAFRGQIVGGLVLQEGKRDNRNTATWQVRQL